jgi:hypothetical protein
MKRSMMSVIVVTVLAGLASLAQAAGGQAPGTGASTIQARPILFGNVQIDPHEEGFFDVLNQVQVDPVTPSAKQGIATFERGNRSAHFLFKIPASTAFGCGCDPTITRLRFLGKKVVSFVDQAVLDQVLAHLRVTPPTNGELVITQILNRRCVVDPTMDPANVDPQTGQILVLPPGQPTCGVVESKFADGNAGAGLFKMEFLMQFQISEDNGGGD